MTYEAWRITYQSSEQAARAAYAERDAARDLADRLALALNTSNHERDNLQAKIAEMEKQEPVGTLHDDGCFVWRETAPHQSNYAGWKMVLYALPGARPAPSVPENKK